MGDDTHEAPAVLEVHEGIDSPIERFRVEAAKAFVDENGVEVDAALLGLHDVGEA